MAVLTIYLTGFGLTSILMILALSAVRAQLRAGGNRVTVRDAGSMLAKCVFWFGFWPFWGWTELRRHLRARP